MSNFIPLPPTYAVADPQVRAVLDVLSRNMQVVIDSGASASTNTTLTSVGGASTFGNGNNSTNITNLAPSYTLDTLTADLKRGAAEVITGALNGTTVMKLEPAGQYVVFQHKNASVLGTVGAYTGDVRTALGITSTGILGGYNRQSDGAWQTTFAIESATGNLTLLGTIRAASVISVNAYLGSTLVSDVVNNAAAVTTKLNKSAADILSGTIEFQSAGGFKTGTIAVDSSGNATGAGVAITSKGIVGRNVSNTTFTIDATTGAATFGGALVAASGSFVGTVSAGAIITDSVTLNSAGGTSLSIIASQASGALPSASFSSTLQTNLSAGVTNILAGTGANYRLTVDATNAFVAFHHKDAKYKGTATTGSGIRPAVGISAAGIAMGYNDASGAWQDSVALSATGDLTVKGTITAGSIIVGSVTIGSGGTTLTAVESNASTALSTANTANTNANTALTTKLNKSASDILSGDITFSSAGGFKTGTISIDSSGNATGAGVAFTSKGIVGRTAGATTFTIDATTGAATFKGDITGASGTFNGDLITTGKLSLTGSGNVISGYTVSQYINSSASWACIYANNTANAPVLTAYTGASRTIYAQNNGSSLYSAIVGDNLGSGFGVQATGNTGTALVAYASSGNAFACQGTMTITSNALVTNLNADLLDGNHASAFVTSAAGDAYSANRLNGSAGTNILRFVQGTVTGAATATFAGTNKPGANSTNVWVQFTIDGTTLYIPAWT